MKQALIKQSSLVGKQTKLMAMRILVPCAVRGFKQTNNLKTVITTTEFEYQERTDKFVQYTDKVYKPSKTITYDRNGELLLFSCDNIRHSQTYLKYPYIAIDFLMPLSIYNFFVDPCKYYFNICSIHGLAMETYIPLFLCFIWMVPSLLLLKEFR